MQSQVSPETAAEPSADPSSLASLLVRSDLIPLALARGDVLLFANAAFCRLFGNAPDLTGSPVAALFAPAHRSRIASILRHVGREPAMCVAEAQRDDGCQIELELRACGLVSGNETLCALFAQDVTAQSRATSSLNLLAFSDPLTGLANRALFADRLRLAILQARRENTDFALLMLDLDRFKPINDQHGHAAGDAALQQIGQRLLGNVRMTETVARLGGDEFAVLLPGIDRPAAAAGVADRLLASIRQPIAVGDLRLTVDASAGLAMFPADGQTVEQLLVAADTALYSAKRQGGGCSARTDSGTPAAAAPQLITWTVAHEVGVPEMDTQHARLAELLNALAAALCNGQDHSLILGEFIRYAAFHFASEERLMLRVAYPDAAAHREIHRQLLADVAGLVLDGDGVSISLVMRYLQEWLFRHVDGVDRELAAVLLAAA